MSDNTDALHALAEQWQSGNPNLDLINRIWDVLEPSAFSLHNLAVLDSRQVVEKLLWPSLSPTSSNQHVVTLAALLNYKKQTRTLSWTLFADDESRFTAFFHRVLSLLLDPSLPVTSRNVLLGFIIAAFQSLEQELARQNCAPLVSVAIWENLHSDSYRDQQLDVVASRRKAWRSANKKFTTASPDVQTRIRLERAWLYTMTLDFFKRINASNLATADLVYCQRFLEFVTDLISQLPTRRYSIVLLKDLNFLPMLRVSTLYKSSKNTTLADLVLLYQHFANFVIADNGDVQDTQSSAHYADIARLQKVALQHFDPKLKVLALSNIASLGKPDELRSHLDALSDLELEQLCQYLDLRTAYPASAGIVTGRNVFLNIIQHAFSPPISLVSDDEDILPTERTLYDPSLLRNETFDGTSPLGAPKLNLQYLSLGDFLWRSLKLQQAEAFYEIRKDMESIVRKLNPHRPRPGAAVEWKGFSKMAIPIEKPAIVDVAQPSVGDVVPAHVRAEVVLDVSRLGDRVRRDWETLRPKDVVFLLAIQPTPDAVRKNGSQDTSSADPEQPFSLLRAAEVVQVQDDKGKPLRSDQDMNGYSHSGHVRRLVLDLDPIAFHHDKENLASGQSDVYTRINVIARRAGRENNFRPMLNSIRQLLSTNGSLPDWLQEVYLGYGLPSAASYPNIRTEAKSIDFLDTFLDWDHLQESFPGVTVKADNNTALSAPFVLDFSQRNSQLQAGNPRKRRHEQMEENDSPRMIKVSTYRPANTGPYPQDERRRNAIRFTPKQTEAIVSGVHPGLSLVVGPPGTGKTDVATQIINLLYHNFPEQRILLVAHSNQALNQLFQKIMALDIDPRHLLRLGHGEEGLESDKSYSKHGRVESFMENRIALLAEVNRLAVTMGAQGAHGNSCETADYFNQVFVQPAWSRFWIVASADDVTREQVADAFPFKKFFSNAPIPDLFPPEASLEQYHEVAKGCQYHLNKLFNELESIRPFEVLRSQRDQANHLLMKEARIIAMTSTHASIRHQEIISLGFRYDTLIMEEAAQVTEIESFIPCALQSPDTKTGQLPLQRIVLVGDHLQNSPIVQNFALRDYSNLEQSLFLRFIRLGVPAIMLDAQGRCRPSIANLFGWRYPGLKDLPHIDEQQDFKHANAGFAHEFQFINIEDYQGQGEREPSPHFIQNLGEAEYAVALYQYMRLLGYPAHSITILAAYAGQRALIRDVLEHRCRGNRLFGLPRMVTTIDKYQGEQNDYIILSLTRTKTVGYLRDVRRLTVALSRARLGLYILGRKALFETCFEMQIAIERLCAKGNAEGQLEVVTGEMYPAQRQVVDEIAVTPIHGVEHLGQYVYEMTQAKVKSLGGNVQMAPSENHDIIEEEEDLDAEVQADAEADPLHESV